MGKYMKKCRKELFLFLSSNLAWAGIGVSLAFILQYITDTAIHGIGGRLLSIILMATAYLILDTVFEFASSYAEIVMRTKLSKLLRNAIVRRIQNCSVEEKEQLGNAHYLSLLNNNVDTVEREYVYGLDIVIFQLFSLLFALTATTLIQPIMTLIVIALCVIPLFIPRLLKSRLEKLNRETLSAKADYMNFLNELMEGFQTIKIFGRESEINQYHDKKNEKTTRKIQFNAKWKRISMSLSYGMGNFVIIGAWIFGTVFVLSGSIDFSELIALTTLMNMVAGPFQIISEYYAGIISGRAIAKDLLSFIDSESEGAKYKSNDKDIRSIELRNVSVERNNSCILADIQLALHCGEKVGIIGSSGSGKSSLLKVIAGIMEIQDGEIFLNDTLLDKKAGITHQDLLYLAQKTDIFSAEIGENITLFKSLPESTVEAAIHKAGLTAWFKRLGRNLHAAFEKSSINLSGGELKRMDFARALVEEATVLLFDEPTAGLDKFHSRSIMEQICLMEDKIVVVSTHDLDEENMLRFDYVYMLSEGKIVAQGMPNKMLINPVYQSLRQGNIEKSY